MRPFNDDGLKFIRSSTQDLLNTSHTVHIYGKQSRGADKNTKDQKVLLKTVEQPRYFSHYVMNLPATAITFLPSFIGLYSSLFDTLGSDIDLEKLPLPMVHVYAFSTKSEDNVAQSQELCEEAMRQLGMPLDGNEKIEPDVGDTEVWDVRDVAPKKRMFCLSFRLPKSVAWRKP